jgi:ubiquitin conjugation factor E4 B
MVERIVTMLNYFLLYLAGPERRKLKVRDPARYGFRPKELLTQICNVYSHLGKADAVNADASADGGSGGASRDGAGASGEFVRAIVSDGRSFRPELFPEALAVLQQLNVMAPEDMRAFAQLAER